MKVENNMVVRIDYTLTDSREQILDTSRGHEPLAYIQGRGHIIPGLENALEGRSTGDSFKVSIPPEEAYGARSEELVQDIPREQFEIEGGLEAGMRFQTETEAGVMLLTVTEVKDDSVTVDANHPLAGETLNFDVTVVDVRGATEDEIETGQVSGPVIVTS